MTEKIISIVENDAGFSITTDRQVIDIGISQDQSCCENFGYFVSEDDLTPFEDALLYGVKHVDECLNVTDLPEYGMDSGDTMFINFETSKGTLQFVAYNSHNGYYGHRAWVHSTQLTLDTTL